MTFLTLVVITALCLVFPPTQMFAVVGAVGLLLIYPYETLGVLLVAVPAFYFFQQHRRKRYDP